MYFFIFIFERNLLTNSEDSDQTFVASDLGLHCLPMYQKKGRQTNMS